MAHWVDIEVGKVVRSVDCNTIGLSIALGNSTRCENDACSSECTPDSLLSGTNFRSEWSPMAYTNDGK